MRKTSSPIWVPLVLLFFLVSGKAWSNNDQELKVLHEEIATIARQHNVASLSYAILQPGQPLYQNSIGDANLATNTAATSETQYRIASVSKMIVGIAIMQLVESGQLALDEKVTDLLPELIFENPWRDSHPVIVEHLVENTTGWDEIALREFAYRNEPRLSLLDALNLYPNSRSSRWPPGTRHAYTNSTATVAALICESVTGMPFEKYAQQYIFSQLDIASADYHNQPVNLAVGYNARQQELAYKPVLMTHAGGLSININDMGKLLQAFIERDDRLLSAQSYLRMEHSLTSNVGEFRAGYGVFNYARYYQGWRFRGHDGALPGWLSELSYSPEHGAGFVVLQNTENNRAFLAVVTAISDHLIANFAAPVLGEQATEPGNMADLAGFYRYKNPRSEKRYLLERLVSSNKLAVESEKARFTQVLPPGWVRELSYIGNQQWQNDKGEVVMVGAQDPILGDVLHYGDRVFKKELGLLALLDKVVLVIWLLCLILAIPLSLVWLYRLRKQHYSHLACRNIRAGLMIAAASAWGFIFFLVFGLLSPINRLGGPTWVTIGLMLSSLLLASVSIYSLWRYIAGCRQPVGRFVKGYGGVFLLMQVLVVIYIASFGMIGAPIWL